ncbi:MAG: hypothetical protein WC378_08820 [Opitutaceae bacterium]
MESVAPDFDKLFAHRGGFAMAFAKLTAFAIVVIRKRSGTTKNGRVIAELDAKQLVVAALARLNECEFLDDGEAVYKLLRRHIDNSVRTIQKRTNAPVEVSIGTGTYEPDAEVIAELEDETSENPADVAELNAEDVFYKTVLSETKSKFKAGGLESQFIDMLIEGWRDRQDSCELLKIIPEQYDALLKRVSRAAIAQKEAVLKKKAL